MEMKFLPQMQDSILEGEAEKIGEDFFERFDGRQRDFIGAASVAEQADNLSQNYYIEMSELRQSLCNLFAVGLYHIFEQQLIRLHRNELIPPEAERVIQELVKKQRKKKNERRLFRELLSVQMIEEMFSEKQIEVSNIKSWNQISELRLVANSIKHADGESCERLKRHRPELFVNPILRDLSPMLAYQQLNFPIFQPLAGESIFVTEEILMEYIVAITEFWCYVSSSGSEYYND